MKKILLGLCFLAFSPIFVLADSAPISEIETKEVEAFFNSYVDSANNYKDDIQSKYDRKAVIKRVVIKPDGTKQTVVIPLDRYFKELKAGKNTAKLVNYKNTYTNKKYEKLGKDEYKVKTTRIPFKDKKGLNAHFIVKRTKNGLKISEESMETNVQKFLKAK